MKWVLDIFVVALWASVAVILYKILHGLLTSKTA